MVMRFPWTRTRAAISIVAHDALRGGNESEERFLSTQADPFTGVKGKEKVGLLRSK
jgi:hypothetical protein